MECLVHHWVRFNYLIYYLIILGMGNNMPTSGTTRRGPMKLYVGSLHTNIEEDMLRGIFEPFGTVSFYFNYFVILL